MATLKTFIQLPKESLILNRLLTLAAIIDLTEAAAATAQEFRVTLPANCRILDVVLDIERALQDASDDAFNDVTITIGDSASATAYITAKQIAAKAATPILFAAAAGAGALTLGNTNGEIAALTFSSTATQAEANAFRDKAEELADDVRAIAEASGLGKVYTVADYLKVVVTPMSGKSLSDLDLGKIKIFVALQQRGELG